MTDPNYTALLLVIDRSGSMIAIRDAMVDALNRLLAEQSALDGLLTVDVVIFDGVIEHTHTMADARTVRIELEPRGGTALMDALGASIQIFGQQLAALPEPARPDTVQVIIVTDGHENSSREYDHDMVRDLITQQTEQYDWDFVFLGANQDAVLTARDLGIGRDSALTYDAGADGVRGMSRSTSRYMTDVRRKRKRGFDEDERGEARGA